MSDERDAVTVPNLLGRIDAAYDRLKSVIDPLPDERLSAPTNADGWAIKDFLAHLATWERGIVAALQHRPRYEAMGLDLETYLSGDEELINDTLFRQNQGYSPAKIRTMLDQVHTSMRAAVAQLQDEDLLRPYVYYQPDEPNERDTYTSVPMVNRIAGNTFAHYEEHLPAITVLAQGGS